MFKKNELLNMNRNYMYLVIEIGLNVIYRLNKFIILF